MLKSVLNRNIVLACSADCPADNQARPLALFLYGTLAVSVTELTAEIIQLKNLLFDNF